MAAPIGFCAFNLFNIPRIPKDVLAAAIKTLGVGAIIENGNYKHPFLDSSIHIKLMKGFDVRDYFDYLVFSSGYTLELYKGKAIATEDSEEIARKIKASIVYYKYY